MTKVFVLARAEWDLEELQEYFENEQEGVGAKFVAAFEQGVEHIEQFPRRYARYLRAIRICPLGPFKVGAFYRIFEEKVYILRALDLRQSKRALRRALKGW